jgi:hypothetical protein
LMASPVCFRKEVDYGDVVVLRIQVIHRTGKVAGLRAMSTKLYERILP